ncbi:MAG: hypothetical protein R3349_01705 [Geminicoccaceae bacterium]|nr:hypothetical protein [Geminicoccaceae bacterium]
MFGSDPAPSARAIEIEQLDADASYPPVASVPARPQLSYTVEQEREIVDALISDRENARYTGSAVRYRSGLSDAPPAGPANIARLRGEDVIGAQEAPGAVSGPPVPRLDDSNAYAGARARSSERAELDDAGLDDFVRGLVDETEAEPDLTTESAVIRRRAPGPQIPGRKGKESAFERLFYWVGEQLGGDDEDAGRVGPTTPSIPPAEPGEADDEEPAERSVPKLKPDESADPPEPAPAKPDDPEQAGLVRALAARPA